MFDQHLGAEIESGRNTDLEMSTIRSHGASEKSKKIFLDWRIRTTDLMITTAVGSFYSHPLFQLS